MHQTPTGNVSGRQLSCIRITEFAVSDPVGCSYVDLAHVSIG